VDRLAEGKLTVNWKPFAPDPDAQNFTVFNHATHFSMAGERGCQSCHRLNPKAKFAVAYRGLDATRFEPNFFAPIKRETCAECHVPESSGDVCTQCHRYHVGEFVSVPIVTEIADRQGAMTRFGTVPPEPRKTKKAPRKTAALGSQKQSETKVRARQGGKNVRQVPVPKRKPVRRSRRTAKASSLPDGYGVRLGSYLTKKRARDSSRRLRRTVAGFLSGQVLRVEQAKLKNGRHMYRVVARSFTKQQAKRTCRRIAAKHKIRCRVTR